MSAFEPLEWLAIGAVAAAAAIGLLHIVALRLRNDREFADLVIRACAIRERHEARLRALRTGADDHFADEDCDVVIVDEADEDPDAPVASQVRRAA